jgi:septal ring factor EnvC (AmiA/AmiB activator)
MGRVLPIGAAPARAAGSESERRVEELERRFVHLEKRLEEVVEVKERLERQLATQNEELRVQRAAIARTQRVLRNLSRPEDAATEPAFKGPGSQPPEGAR